MTIISIGCLDQTDLEIPIRQIESVSICHAGEKSPARVIINFRRDQRTLIGGQATQFISQWRTLTKTCYEKFNETGSE